MRRSARSCGRSKKRWTTAGTGWPPTMRQAVGPVPPSSTASKRHTLLLRMRRVSSIISSRMRTPSILDEKQQSWTTRIVHPWWLLFPCRSIGGQQLLEPDLWRHHYHISHQLTVQLFRTGFVRARPSPMRSVPCPLSSRRWQRIISLSYPPRHCRWWCPALPVRSSITPAPTLAPRVPMRQRRLRRVGSEAGCATARVTRRASGAPPPHSPPPPQCHRLQQQQQHQRKWQQQQQPVWDRRCQSWDIRHVLPDMRKFGKIIF